MSLENRKEWEVSHVIPFSKGGDEDIENLRPLCRTCNRAMRNISLQDFCREKYPETCEQIFANLGIA
jgi:5-methylcytosine-specific restriction endonuclease McrA